MSGTLKNKVASSSLASLLVKVGYIILQFTCGVILARTLEPNGLGVYTITISVVQILSVVSQFGFPAFLVRTIANARARTALGEIRLTTNRAILTTFYFSVLVGLTIFTLSMLHSDYLNTQSDAIFNIWILLIPILAIAATISGAIRGLGYILYSQLPDEIIRPSIFLLLLAIINYFTITISSSIAILIYIISSAIALSLAFFALCRLMPNSDYSIKTPKISILTRQSFPFLLLAGTQIVNQNIDVLMLSALTDFRSVGYFRVALQISEGIGIVLFAISISIAPRIAHLQAINNFVELQKLIVWSHRSSLAIIFPLSILVCIFSEFIITTLFGYDYYPAVQPLSILVLAKIPYAVVAFSGLALSMLGHASFAALMTSVTIIMNILFNLALIPHYGLQGAALATALSSIMVNIGGLMFLSKMYGQNFSALASIKEKKHESS